MSTTELLREQIKQQLDNAGDKALRMVQSILNIAQEDETSTEEYGWETLPQNVKEDIGKAMKELDSGNGIPHSEVVKKYPGLWLR